MNIFDTSQIHKTTIEQDSTILCRDYSIIQNQDARLEFRFTIAEIRELTHRIGVPDPVVVR
jgi:hypothetical protein